MTAIITPRNPREERLLYKSEVTSPVSAVEVDSAVDWTAFDYYRIRLRELLMTTNNTRVVLCLKNGGGYVSTASAYKYLGGYGIAGYYYDTGINVSISLDMFLSNATPLVYPIDIVLTKMNDATTNTGGSICGGQNYGSGRVGFVATGFIRNAAEINEGIQLSANSSTIAALKLDIFGGRY